MFLWRASLRNRLTIAMCAFSIVSGCAMQQFLRVDERRVDERLRFFLGGGGNSLVLSHGAEAFLIDTKFAGASQSLRHRVEEELLRDVRRILLTHSHFDHADGLERYHHLGPVLVHENTKRRLEARGVRARWVEVNGAIELQLGDELVRIWFPGKGHTDGDLVAYLVKRKLLVTGDLVTAQNEPVIDVSSGGDVLAFRHTLDALLQLDFVTALPGHGEPVGRATLVRLRDYLAQLELEVRDGQSRGWTEDEVVAGISMKGAPDLEPVPFGANREKTTRLMDRALRARKE
ncbi:MAG: MBL fold metallo-hydrolase [Archangiaceae bacterium]|nr:MBL fold metallo-hydrolase [Archangiaceae bacterium]